MLAQFLTPYSLLLLVGPLFSLSRVFQPWLRAPRTSDDVEVVPIPLLARLRLHAGVLWVEAFLMILGLALGWLTWLSVVALVVIFTLLLAMPARYRLSDEGIALGRTRLRRWTEFGGLSRRRGGARLQGVAGSPSMTVWLSGSREDDDFVLRLRRRIKRAYQGRDDDSFTERDA
nr:hypothetical protein [Chloroflexota bacterium]